LEGTQRCKQESPVLGQKLDDNRRVDGDIPSDTEPEQAVEKADRAKV